MQEDLRKVTKPGQRDATWAFDPFRGFIYPRLLPPGTALLVILAGLAGLAAVFAADIVLLPMAFRCARRLGGGVRIATLAFVPVLQIGAIAWLALAPTMHELSPYAHVNAPHVKRRPRAWPAGLRPLPPRLRSQPAIREPVFS